MSSISFLETVLCVSILLFSVSISIVLFFKAGSAVLFIACIVGPLISRLYSKSSFGVRTAVYKVSYIVSVINCDTLLSSINFILNLFGCTFTSTELSGKSRCSTNIGKVPLSRRSV